MTGGDGNNYGMLQDSKIPLRIDDDMVGDLL